MVAAHNYFRQNFDSAQINEDHFSFVFKQSSAKTYKEIAIVITG